jgi:hypothetical protein
MSEPVTEAHRLLFLGGLHRSGTTPAARWIAQHPEVSAFRNTGVWEDEGQHLQDVYATARQHGGPGRFALDHEAHLTESSPLVTDESRRRIWAAWSPHWDLSKPVLLEKSPPNLIRMRFLQALFPDNSYFLAIVRHPLAVAYATRKWRGLFDWVPRRLTRRGILQASLHPLLQHWVEAHERFLADASSLQNIALVRYEDLVTNCPGELSRVFRFSGLEPISGDWKVEPALNERYIGRWERSSANPVKRVYLRRLERTFEDRIAVFGYSLREPRRISPPSPTLARYFADH